MDYKWRHEQVKKIFGNTGHKQTEIKYSIVNSKMKLIQ